MNGVELVGTHPMRDLCRGFMQRGNQQNSFCSWKKSELKCYCTIEFQLRWSWFVFENSSCVDIFSLEQGQCLTTKMAWNEPCRDGRPFEHGRLWSLGRKKAEQAWEPFRRRWALQDLGKKVADFRNFWIWIKNRLVYHLKPSSLP